MKSLLQYINESYVKVTVYGGKTHHYNKEKIKELIEDFDQSISSDDLPKWIYQSGLNGTSLPKTKPNVKAILTRILNHKGKVLINVQSDNLNLNQISFE